VAAAAGWCYRRVVVRPSNESVVDVKQLEADGRFLFQSSCGSDLQVVWRSPTELHIDGKIRLTYEVTAK
jgi:hypothetical protein